jgi:hypothetical protein
MRSMAAKKVRTIYRQWRRDFDEYHAQRACFVLEAAARSVPTFVKPRSHALEPRQSIHVGVR